MEDNKHADTFDLAGALWKIQIAGLGDLEKTSYRGRVPSLLTGSGSPWHMHIASDQAIVVLEGRA